MMPQTHGSARGVSLTELLVVLAILAGMIGLLLPAVQHSRAAARSSVCQNNLRQLGIAARTHYELTEGFPIPKESWTVTLLQWMEEKPLMESLRRGNVQQGIRYCPRIYRCPSQPEAPIDESGVVTSHYTLQVGRIRKGGPIRGGRIRDRNADFVGEKMLPWYVGPTAPRTGGEGKGPHRGAFNES